MVESGERQFSDDQCINAADENPDVEESVDVASSVVEAPATANPNPSMSRRLSDIFLEGGDEDLLLQGADIGDGFLQWLGALDMQVMGACRADERLKPLLKLNISGGEAEDRLLAQLFEHFEPSEVGILARCLCAPLVSIRVGKINKQGSLLCPTSVRGNLSLTLLPTSDLRVSFNGDDGSVERLATLRSDAQCASIKIEKIPADMSGRSFLLGIADNVALYFWCSEKSQLLGTELLRKMKDLLSRKPSLSELTGISKVRLDYFANQLIAYLGGSIVSNAQQSSGVLPSDCPSDVDLSDSSKLHSPQSSFTCEKRSQFQQYSRQGSTAILNQLEDLYAKSSSVEARRLSSENISTARETLIGNDNVLPISLSLASTNDADLSNSIDFAIGKLEANLAKPFAVLNVVDAFGTPLDLPLLSGPKVQFPSSSSSHLSPQYCWCPPVASTLHYTLRDSHKPLSTETLCLPPFPSFLSAGGSTKLSFISFSEVPAVDFPSFQPEPLISRPTSQQIPTFTSLMCDPIVHVPMIDVCSSGPGYLFSAGPAIATTTPSFPTLNLNLVDPHISKYESAIEQSSRETLRMLINSTNSQPTVWSSRNDEPNVLSIGGSRGFYCGTRAVPAIFSGSPIMSLSEKSVGDGVGKVCPSRDDKERPQDSESFGFDSGIE